MQPKYLTVKQAAKLLCCGTTKVYLAVNNGQIPATKFGSQWLIDQEALEKRLAQNSNKPKILYKSFAEKRAI